MPTAKPRRDPTGSWKVRQFSERTWREANAEVEQKLRPLYPHQVSEAEVAADMAAGFCHPADEWARYLLNEACSVVSLALSMRLRPNNEEMREEIKQTLGALRRAAEGLTNLSGDLVRMLPQDVDPLDCRDSIKTLIPHIEALKEAIKRLPKAIHSHEARHDAACKMAFYILRILRDDGIPPTATVGTDTAKASTAVKILAALGAPLQLKFAEATWKDIIREVRPSLKASPVAPEKKGASPS